MKFDRSFTKDDAILKNHFLDGMGHVMPGAGYMALLLDFFQKEAPDKKIARIKNIKWLKPFVVEEPKILQCTLEPRRDAILHFKFTDAKGESIFCDGLLETVIAEESPGSVREDFSFPDISKMTEQSVEEYYQRLGEAGYRHTGPLKCIERIWQNDQGYRVQLSSKEEDPVTRMTALLDGVHQARGFLNVRFIPCKIDEVVFHQSPLPPMLYVDARLCDYEEELSFSSLSLMIFDEDGRSVMDYRRMKAFSR